jgi:prepilin-type N-terminal cleavage/methylation domain-containing protein
MTVFSASDPRGFTLIELAIVLIIIGILSAVAMKQIGVSIETANYEQTSEELDQLARAIAGNSDLYSDGVRTDFGYVGDIGALPPTLDALVRNPGGLSTWDGPYIEPGPGGDDFKKDAWQALYVYIDTLIRSTGSGVNIDKIIAGSTAALLANTVAGTFRNADGTTPGTSTQIRWSFD